MSVEKPEPDKSAVNMSPKKPRNLKGQRKEQRRARLEELNYNVIRHEMTALETEQGFQICLNRLADLQKQDVKQIFIQIYQAMRNLSTTRARTTKERWWKGKE